MTERKAFEVQIKKQFPTVLEEMLLDRLLSGRYSSLVIEHAWLAWQAATAATQERCAQAVISLEKQQWFPSQKAFAEACADAIRKGCST